MPDSLANETTRSSNDTPLNQLSTEELYARVRNWLLANADKCPSGGDEVHGDYVRQLLECIRLYPKLPDEEMFAVLCQIRFMSFAWAREETDGSFEMIDYSAEAYRRISDMQKECLDWCIKGRESAKPLVPTDIIRVVRRRSSLMQSWMIHWEENKHSWWAKTNHSLMPGAPPETSHGPVLEVLKDEGVDWKSRLTDEERAKAEEALAYLNKQEEKR